MPSTRMRRWSHWTLRSRLALASTALAAVALLVANGAGLLLLDSYLLSQVDSGLKTSGGSLHGPVPAKTLTAGRLNELLRNPDGPGSIFAVRFGSNSRLYVYDTTSGTVTQFPEGTVAPGPRLPGRAELAEHAGKPFTVLGESGAEWRIYVQALDGKGGLLVNTTSLAEVDKISDRLLLIDATVMSIVLALLGAVAALLVRVGLRPLTRMQATSESIAAGDFRQRVTGTDPHTEPGRLGRAINAMLGRVESEITARTASEQRLRRFLADASHELRTPSPPSAASPSSTDATAISISRTPCAALRPRPSGWACWWRTWYCWPGSTSSASRNDAPSICWSSRPMSYGTCTPAPRGALCASPPSTSPAIS